MGAHGHDHDHGHHNGGTGRLALVFALTVAYTAFEIVGGLLSNSLALLADAGHMMTDNLALGIALVAAWSAKRPPGPTRTYGYGRAEILAALANGSLLLGVAGFVAWEALSRLREPPEVRVGIMAAIAAGGLLVNAFAAIWLHGAGQRSLNVRAAYLHVLGDLLGSIGALAAAGIMRFSGARWPDPVVSLLIAVFLAVSSSRLLREAVHVLMEGAPRGVDAASIQQCLSMVRGVSSVHDLHVWSLAGGTPLLTAHLVSDHSRPTAAILRDATAALAERFAITHTTLQIEPPDYNVVVETATTIADR